MPEIKCRNLLPVYRFYNCTIRWLYAFMTLCPVVYAQEQIKIHTAEAIPLRLPTFTPLDTQYIRSMIRPAREIRHLYPDSALQLLQRGYDLSVDKGYYDGTAFALMLMGRIANDKGDAEKALSFFQLDLPFPEQALHYTHLLTVWYTDFGSIYYYQGRYTESLDYYIKVLNHLKLKQNEDRDSRVLLVTIYTCMANVMHRLDQEEKALGYLKKADSVSTTYALYKEMAFVSYNKGDIFRHAGKYIEAEKAFFSTMKIVQEHHLSEMQQLTVCGLTALYLKKNEP